MPESRVLHYERLVNALPEDVLRAFTHPTALRDWLSNSASSERRVGNQPHVGSSINLRWNDGHFVCGAVTRLDLPNLLAFTWNSNRDLGESLVTVSCTAQDGGTLVKLDHQVGDGAEWSETAAGLNKHWPELLENLQSVLESGNDLRQLRRPRLGIMMDELTAEKAAKLGVPVKEGVLIEGTVENTGARAAGLVKDDVLFSLNGVVLQSWDSFGQALQGLKAGDRPLVEFYRGAEKHSVPLELSSFPIPEPPLAPADLAAKVSELNQTTRSKMADLLSGLSDAQAGMRPSEKEWSAKELVAHFILCERDIQSWVANMLMDNDIPDSLMFQPNVDERIGALVARLGSLEALMNELALAQGETCALLAALPEKFTSRRKHLYRRAAEWVLEVGPTHFEEEHLEQFKTAIEAAKGE